jgi:copper transport protein
MRLVLAVLFGCWLVLATASPASAHAQLIGSDPADGALVQEAPETVTLSFNEPVRLTPQEITVYDAEGRPVPSSARVLGTDVLVELDEPDTLGRGTFVIGWFVVSADGHPISGSLSFSVGKRSETVSDPPPPPTSSRMVTGTHGVLGGAMYLGLLLATGLTGFVALILPRSYNGAKVRARIRLLARAAAAVAVAAAVLIVPVASTYARGSELPVALTGFDTSLVTDELISAALILVGLAMAIWPLTVAPPDRRQRAVLLAGCIVALAGPPLVGHTRAFQPAPVLVAADWVHLLAGATWLGGLVGLVVSLRALAGREQLAALTLARFSTLAGGLLLAVAATGSILAWRVLAAWEPFVTTTYGRLLLVKIGVALLVAGLAGWNRFRLLPRVRAAVGFGDRREAAHRITSAIRVEAIALVGLLAVTGFLVNQSPRPAPVTVPAGQTGVQQASIGDIEVLVLMSPQRQGRNQMLIQLQDETGEPVVTDRPPEVQLLSDRVDLGSVPLASTDAGTWAANVLLPNGGTWVVQVGLRLSRFEKPVTSVRFDVTGD